MGDCGDVTANEQERQEAQRTSRSLPPTQLAIAATAAPNNCGEKVSFRTAQAAQVPAEIPTWRLKATAGGRCGAEDLENVGRSAVGPTSGPL